MTFSKNIKDRMNMALASKGRTFVLNPRSKFQVRRKIKDVRLTFGNGAELTFFHPLPRWDGSNWDRTSRLFTITPTFGCMESFSIVD
tara:strand:- start:1132 stop:1392 length:261 start_codon:yes stop_codon:yes gene_type:complete